MGEFDLLVMLIERNILSFLSIFLLSGCGLGLDKGLLGSATYIFVFHDPRFFSLVGFQAIQSRFDWESIGLKRVND